MPVEVLARAMISTLMTSPILDTLVGSSTLSFVSLRPRLAGHSAEVAPPDQSDGLDQASGVASTHGSGPVPRALTVDTVRPNFGFPAEATPAVTGDTVGVPLSRMGAIAVGETAGVASAGIDSLLVKSESVLVAITAECAPTGAIGVRVGVTTESA